jgi:hypothetical protein
MISESLLEYCQSEAQKRSVQARIDTKTAQEAADLLGISLRNIHQNIANVKKNAAKRGWSPEHDMIRTVPEGFVAKGVSTLYGDDGQVKIQWVKSALGQEEQTAAIKRALDEFLKDHEKKSPPVPKPKKKKKDQELAVINIGDAHFGMYADKGVSGEDYDCQIAADRHKDVFMRLMNNAPDCETLIINQLGDYFHSDTYTSTTTKGTPVDTDGRLENIVLVGLEVMSFMVEESLKRFNKVIVRHCKGNHDAVLTQLIRCQQQAYWRNNKRVSIEMSPTATWVHQHGKTAFMTTHGDTLKHAKMAEFFAGRYPEVWGASEHRYCWHGHIHSKKISAETYGQTITESFAGLPPSDAWHDASGYVSGQSMCLIVLDKDKGEVRRSTERI